MSKQTTVITEGQLALQFDYCDKFAAYWRYLN